MKKIVMNHELRDDAKVKFSNSDKPASDINMCEVLIFDECLNEVFDSVATIS